MRRKLHYYSDCPFFAGCENMLANFLNSEALAEHFDVSFSYNHSPEYEAGLRRRVANAREIYPLHLFCVGRLARRIGYRPARIAFRILAFITLLRYIFIALNTYKLWKFFGTIGPLDILHINNGGFPAAYSTYAAVYAAHLRRISRIVYVVNNIAEPYSITRWLDWPFDRLVVRCSHKFVTGSEYAGVVLKETLSLPASKLISIYNGIMHRPTTETSYETRTRLGLDLDEPALGVIGLMDPRKGHLIAIKAIQLISSLHKRTSPVLLIEGIGGIRNELQEYVHANNLQAYVKFIGTEENIMNFMQAVDVILLPSISNEDFPNVVIEAMGMGKAVIASQLCGTPEQINHGIDGLLVEPANETELAEAILGLLDGDNLRSKLGRAAAERFQKDFTAEIAVGKYIDLYESFFAS